MADELKTGDKVSWSSHGGTARGEIVREITAPMSIKGHKVAASAENPEFLVKTAEGKLAAHKLEALRKS